MDLEKAQKQRWLIYASVLVVLLVPIVFGVVLKPAPMKTSEKAFEYINSLDGNKTVLISIDWGPGTAAENEPQTKLVIEHLLRRRIPFIVTSLYVLATPFLDSLPKEVANELSKENPNETWEYGKDWVNIGFMPNGLISVQSLAKAKNWSEYLRSDAYGRRIKDLPLMQKVNTLNDVGSLVEITGLQGVFSTWLQFFQIDGFTPKFIHGCTSISIPEAFIFFSSGQLTGFFEGIAGAAWYEILLNRQYLDRRMSIAQEINTGTSFAQILVIAFVIFGNIRMFLGRDK